MKAKTTVPLSTGDSRRAVARFGRAPRTPAVPLLPPDADQQTWLDARRKGPEGYRIGASEIAAVLGESPWQSPFSLWWGKHAGWQTSQDRAQRWGHKLEAVIAEVFAEDRPDLLVCRAGAALWAHPEHPWMTCSPDFLAVRLGVCTDERGGTCEHPPHLPCGRPHVEPVECKSDKGGKGWGKPGTNQVPAHHRMQLLWQCAIFNAPRGHLVRNDVPYVVEYDDAARAEVAQWIERAREFVTSLEIGAAPNPDGHKATERALIDLNPAVDVGETAVVGDDIAEAYETWHDQLAFVKDQFEQARNQLRAAMGRAESAMTGDGRVFAKRSVFKRRGYEVAPCVVDRLDRKHDNDKEQAK
ncbi:YqaJ viral recombinase family protein [Micromonospora sp. 4G55]|uniref:YqaJ viral recombinase family protein n=1 Tax=Micromonospora sp. 4G55 TaxID=2806102 RepID=UPI001A3AE691|nr:YqaJ viral recombinase family protein [Micromonospora sp. 4G55]MBM0256368.1 YqaJ viral recombinase family protein [Micromonospora sp. 4G55]